MFESAAAALDALKGALRGGHAESVALMRVLARDGYGGKLCGDRVVADGTSEVDVTFPDMVTAARFAWAMWHERHMRVLSDLRDIATSLWEPVTLTVDIDDETYQRMVATLRAENKTVCPSGAVITWHTRTTPDPTPVDATQQRTVTDAVVLLRYSEQARVSITHYSGALRSDVSWVSVLVPGAGHRSRYVRADRARRVAERVVTYVDARWGVDSKPWT